jgi:heme/copper-type cytochrome/quinol oxidase subunit 2
MFVVTAKSSTENGSYSKADTTNKANPSQTEETENIIISVVCIVIVVFSIILISTIYCIFYTKKEQIVVPPMEME